ncbi:methyltransferase [Stenotrophomonas maltophilia]|nr:methyltransferase [Stenotrophomonas maltophilia]
MFNPQTLPDIGNATSSAELRDGPLQLDLLGGPTTANSGPAAPRASRSPSRVKEKPRMTIGTCGPTSFASSVPDGPLSSWENRLRRRLARTGSTECLLTWKQKTTPAGRSLSQLVPSTRPTDETACGLWRTPNAHVVDAKSNVVKLEGRKPSDPQVGLADQVAALWPTPTASLADKGVRSTEGAIREAARNHGPDLAAVSVAAMWPTPLTNDSLGSGYCYGPKRPDGRRAEFLKLPGVALVASGLPHRGSSVTTERPGALSPAFVCWLMGFPAAWDVCAPTATPSSRKSRRK